MYVLFILIILTVPQILGSEIDDKNEESNMERKSLKKILSMCLFLSALYEAFFGQVCDETS
mgnify:CR=1 FL=1